MTNQAILSLEQQRSNVLLVAERACGVSRGSLLLTGASPTDRWWTAPWRVCSSPTPGGGAPRPALPHSFERVAPRLIIGCCDQVESHDLPSIDVAPGVLEMTRSHSGFKYTHFDIAAGLATTASGPGGAEVLPAVRSG